MTGRRIILQVILAFAIGAGPHAAFAQCAGDCDNNGAVAINELIRCVRVALGAAGGAACGACDSNGNGKVEINDLIVGVTNALRSSGCTLGGSCDLPANCSSGHCTDSVCCAAAACSEGEFCAAGTGVCTSGVPTATRTPTATPTHTPSETPSTTPTLTPVHTATSTPRDEPQVNTQDLTRASARMVVQNVKSYGMLSFGYLNASGGPRSGEGGAMRLAMDSRIAVVSGLDVDLCPLGGNAIGACAVEDGLSTLVVDYEDCAFSTSAGNRVSRSGSVRQEVADPTFCDTRLIADGVEETIIADIVQVETDGEGTSLSSVSVDIQSRFSPDLPLVVDCGGVQGVQEIDGVIDIDCLPEAQALSGACPQGGGNRLLELHQMELHRSSGGSPCALVIESRGAMSVDDRDTLESFHQAFDQFSLTEVAGPNGSAFEQNGQIVVDCLPTLVLNTRNPIEFERDAPCPSAGRVRLNVRKGFTDPEEAASAATTSGLPNSNEIDLDVFRAADGTGYAVLRNLGKDAEKGAEAVLVTTLVGAIDAQVTACSSTEGQGSAAQAVATASEAMSPSLVFKSPIVDHVFDPEFNRNAENGRGRICIGEDCTGLQICPSGGNCFDFSIFGNGSTVLTSPTTGIPAAELVTNLLPFVGTCGSIGNQQTYRFGGGPTLSTAPCAAAPASGFEDGFLLRNNQTLILAFQTPPAGRFRAGYGGFPVDLDGIDQDCSNAVGNQFLTQGVAEKDEVLAPQIIFLADQRVGFDYDGDEVRDETSLVSERCFVDDLRMCQVP